jgi:dihydroorotase
MLGDSSPAELVIRQAHVLDPATGLDGIMDVRLSSGCIVEIGKGMLGQRELDADGLHLFPGFVDVHAHWRTPGREDEEDIESGSAAAAAGGFTGVVMMPNTDPIVALLWLAVSSVAWSGSLGCGSASRRPSTSGSLARG